MENMTNAQKIELSILLTDALESTAGLRQQIEEIQAAFNHYPKLHRSMEWLDMIRYGLEKMKKALDEITDRSVLEGTDSKPGGKVICRDQIMLLKFAQNCFRWQGLQNLPIHRSSNCPAIC